MQLHYFPMYIPSKIQWFVTNYSNISCLEHTEAFSIFSLSLNFAYSYMPSSPQESICPWYNYSYSVSTAKYTIW